MNTIYKLLIVAAGMLAATSGIAAQSAQNFYPGGFAELRRNHVSPGNDAEGDRLRNTNVPKLEAHEQRATRGTAEMAPSHANRRKDFQQPISGNAQPEPVHSRSID